MLGFTVVAFLCAAAWLPVYSRAQGIEQQLHSFGFPGAANPQAPLIQGRDGALYGTTYNGGTNALGTIFRIETNGAGYSVLYSFWTTSGDGANPRAGLIQGSDGALYGTTEYGGTNGSGAVFKIGTNGAGYRVLYSFSGTGGNGANPYSDLVQGSDGALYGTTYSGGTNFGGTIFKIGTNGASYSVLYRFTGTGGDGANPYADLVQGSDGALYGTTYSGGTNSSGTVFRIETNGAGYSVLYSFAGTGGDGANPYADLIQGSDGTLYGTTISGGTNSYGTIFKIGTNGAEYSVLYRFTGTGGDGANPEGLVQGSDGALYGTCIYGGTNFTGGTVFKIGTNGAGYSVLYNFGGEDVSPCPGLVQGIDGALYGTTSQGGPNGWGTVFEIGTNGAGYSVLYDFTGTGGDGANPYYAGLIQGIDGALYGTTSSGGTNGLGTVFKIATNGGGYSVLYSFGGSGSDGQNPAAGLIQGIDGALYGTTYNGGTNYYGTVFKIGTNGAGYSVLYSFASAGGDGGSPQAALVQGRDGALYGTTSLGGTNGSGTVFKIGTDGSGYRVIYIFGGDDIDGANPYAGLIQGSDGALYGTTYGGGTYAKGTVFEIGTNGAGYRVLYTFMGTDGGSPEAVLVQGSDGALYGTTSYYGANLAGTVFKIGTNGAGFSVLYYFTGTGGDGSNPYAGLVQGSDGALYGTTYGGGISNVGTVFKIGTNGARYSVLYSFGGTGVDGQGPEGLLQGNDGALYGTTSNGGTNGLGTVFRLVASAQTLKPGQLLLSKLPDGNVQISFLPPFSVASGISASTNLSHWIPLTNLSATTNPVYYEDLVSTNYPRRFYRAVWVVP